MAKEGLLILSYIYFSGFSCYNEHILFLQLKQNLINYHLNNKKGKTFLKPRLA